MLYLLVFGERFLEGDGQRFHGVLHRLGGGVAQLQAHQVLALRQREGARLAGKISSVNEDVFSE